MADKVVCPSLFVMESIPQSIRRKKHCRIAPFGSPTEMLLPDTQNSSVELKILFVGSMSQRKGLADVFKAMKSFKKQRVSLSVLGQPSLPKEFYRKQYSEFIYFPPCANNEVRKIMSMHDVLILPSIIEGRALVQQEALACGLPIIVTPNAGAEDLIETGVTGHLIPIRSPEKIREKIEWFLENKEGIPAMRRECQLKASTFTWENYAKTIFEQN